MLTKRVCHRNSQTWSSAHQCGQSLSNVTKLGNCFFNNCQSLSNVGKCDVTKCVQSSNVKVTSHISYNTCCPFVFANTIQNCSMSNRFSRCMRNIQIWSGAEVCRSCRSRKMPKMKHLLETFGFDIVESEPSEFSKSAYNLCSW